MPSFSVGQRVVTISSADAASKTDNSSAALERGTVRYVGEVAGTKGEWIGVEWDDEGRGRHDGTHDGNRYFSVRESAASSGSFVRETKIRGGTALIEGVRSRYGQDFEDTIDVEGLREVQKSMNAPLLELVGFDKLSKRQREFHKLRVISVRGHLVDRLGDSEGDRNIGEELANVQSLDLSETLIHDWNEIAEIAGRLRRLESLDVGRNALFLPEDSEALQKLQGALSNLTQLKLAYLEQTWEQVVAIASTLPRLEYLSVAANGISRIGALPAEGTAFRTLQSIDLSGNPIAEWSHIMEFAGLPNLQGLNVAECKIAEIIFPESEDRPFPALISLNLSNNLITDWQSVARLNVLGITDLRMRSNPVMETEDGGRCRQLLIASIASLFVCNGTSVDRSERRGAEIDYWKLYGQQYLKARNSDQERVAFAIRHPRYAEFVEAFGDPDDIDVNKVEDTTIKGNLVAVRIECPSKPGFKTVTKKLPPTMQVRKLRPLLQRVVGVRGHTLELSYKCMVYPDLIMPMDDELKEIDFYNIKNDDIIYVNF